MAIVNCNRHLFDFVRALRQAPAWTLFVSLMGLVTRPAATQSDADFLAAKDAFERSDRAKLDALAIGLKGHLLAPYVTYWRIKLGIDDVDYDTVRGFLTQY